MRSHPGTSLSDPGGLIGPPWPLPTAGETAPDPEATAETETADEATDG
jgi:rod shape-determining protein MreC